MIVSNEPGYYKGGEGGFGVRIENLLEIVDSGISNEALGRRCDVQNLVFALFTVETAHHRCSRVIERETEQYI